jgi:DNA-binding NarL/FixJ family response regulator
MKPTIKILVADDHKLFRRGIIKLLSEQASVYILGEAENGAKLIEEYFRVYPDIILADIAMPVMSGLEAVKKIKEKDPNVKALFLSMFDSDEYIYKVIKSGGMGLINKNIMEGELIYAIEKVYNNEKYFRGKWTNESLEQFIKNFESSKIELNVPDTEISFREEQILKFLNEGLSSKDMAEKLNLSKKTVDFYRSNIMRKFNLKSVPDLIRFSIRYFDKKNRIENSENNANPQS